MISVMKGDITGLDFDIIVNPANRQLLPGSGINQKIFARAGRGLLNEVLQLPEMKAGQVVMTDAYHLPCTKIIHAVGPIFNFNVDEEGEMLASCYWNAVSLAYDYLRSSQKKQITLAFPPISTGPYGFPREQAAHTAVRTVHKVMRLYPDAKAIHVIFILEDQQDYLLYKKEIRREIHG